MEASRPRKIFSPLNILYFVVGTLLLALLLLQVDFDELLNVIRGVPVGMLALGGVLYLCKGLARGFRFWRINAQSQVGFWKMLRLTLATSLASQLLPLKLGELTYIYAARRDFGASLSQGLSTLIVIRIFDLLAVAGLFVLAALALALPASLTAYFEPILVFIILLVLLLAALIFAGRYFTKGFDWLNRLPGFRRSRLLHKLQTALGSLLAEFGKYRGMQYLELVGYPLVEWGINFVMYAVLLRGIGLPSGLFDAVVAVTFAVLASLLPINSLGNFGTQEAGWMTGMMLLGYSQETALTSAFATHLLSLGYMVILGGAGWLSYAASSRNAPRAAAPAADEP